MASMSMSMSVPSPPHTYGWEINKRKKHWCFLRFCSIFCAYNGTRNEWDYKDTPARGFPFCSCVGAQNRWKFNRNFTRAVFFLLDISKKTSKNMKKLKKMLTKLSKIRQNHEKCFSRKIHVEIRTKFFLHEQNQKKMNKTSKAAFLRGYNTYTH